MLFFKAKLKVFSCSLNVLYWGLGISKIAIFDRKKYFFSGVNYFTIFVIETQDLDPKPVPDAESFYSIAECFWPIVI